MRMLPTGDRPSAAQLRPLLDRPVFDGQFDSVLPHDVLAEDYAAEVAADSGRDVWLDDTGGMAIGRDLEWDSRFFDLPCYRIEYVRLTDPSRQLLSLAHGLKARGIRLCFLRTSSGDSARAAIAGSLFRLVSTKLLMQKDLEAGASIHEGIRTLDDVPVEGRAPVIGAAADLARRRFGFGRFFADPRIGADRASALYASWVRQAADLAPSRFLYVERSQKELGGFAVWEPLLRNGQTFGLLQLVVAASGVPAAGRRLVAAIETALTGEGIPLCFANVDVANTGAMTLYGRSGFMPFCAVDEYHGWLV